MIFDFELLNENVDWNEIIHSSLFVYVSMKREVVSFKVIKLIQQQINS